MNNDEMFLLKNYEKKVTLLQDEHKTVLRIIYENACEIGAVHDFQLNDNLVQSMRYSKIKEKANMSDMVLNICLLDLDRMGFILNTMRNPYKETEYAIFFLGLEYFKQTS